MDRKRCVSPLRATAPAGGSKWPCGEMESRRGRPRASPLADVARRGPNPGCAQWLPLRAPVPGAEVEDILACGCTEVNEKGVCPAK
jgi:hypothetical protein